MPANGSVVYVMADKLGGIMSLNSNLIRYRQADAFAHHAILLHDKLSAYTRFDREIVGANTQVTFEYSSFENLYAVLRRLRDMLPKGPGVLVSNNSLELDMLDLYDSDRTVMQIVHDEYNLGLALAHEPVVDVFVAHSRFYYGKLRTALPMRQDSIFYLPYGIPLSPTVRQPESGPLRLIFVGRLHAGKGIFDLPAIDRLLLEAGLEVEWTIVGDGPQKQSLMERWNTSNPGHVSYFAPDTNQEVLALCAQGDIFVLPTRFEGFPVSLLEAMSAGLVPVVSHLPSGIPEVVTTETGFHPAVGDCAGFAKAILELDRDRERLETLSRACRRTVEERFDIRERVKAYQSLFSRYQDLRRPRPPKAGLRGSRLDQPWLPNWLVKTLRSVRRELAVK